MLSRGVRSVTESVGALSSLSDKVVSNLAEEIIGSPESFSKSQFIDILHDLSHVRFDTHPNRDLFLKTMRSIGRQIHPLFLQGQLTPLETAKIAKSYGTLRYNHHTFLKSCTALITHQWSTFKADVSSGERTFEDDVPQVPKSFKQDPANKTYSMGLVSNAYEETTRYPYFDMQFARHDWQLGFGVHDNYLPNNIKISTQNLANILIHQPPSPTVTQQELSVGQMSVILDGFLHSRAPEWAGDPNVLQPASESVLERLKLANCVATLDPQQTLSAMIVVARTRRGNRDETALVRRLTDRMIHAFFMQSAHPDQLALFLKELAYWSSFKRKYRLKTKPQTRFETTRFKVRFLHERRDHTAEQQKELANNTSLYSPEDENSPVLGEHFATALEKLCQEFCERLGEFSVSSGCKVVESVSLLDMVDEGFYQAVLPWLRRNVGEMDVEDIKRVQNGLNRRKLDDRDFFWRLGLQHQKLHGEKNMVHLKHRRELFVRV